jgi:hypothetical protein
MSSSTVNVDIPSGSPLPLEIGGTGTPIQSDLELAITQPIVTQSTSTANSTANLDLKVEPLDLKIEPLKIDTDSTIDVKPLKIDTDSTIDLKPVAIDTCTTIKLAPLPPIKLEQPYSQHFGFTFMGMELFGFTTTGRYETLLNSPGKGGCCSSHSGEAHHHGQEARPASSAAPEGGGGLRVRVNSN